jgi:hypothetical protein
VTGRERTVASNSSKKRQHGAAAAALPNTSRTAACPVKKKKNAATANSDGVISAHKAARPSPKAKREARDRSKADQPPKNIKTG